MEKKQPEKRTFRDLADQIIHRCPEIEQAKILRLLNELADITYEDTMYDLRPEDIAMIIMYDHGRARALEGPRH